MSKPSKYDRKYGRQKAYRQSPKGKATEKRYEKSDKGRKRKRDWAQKERLKVLSAKSKEFIETYGDIDEALDLLNEREEEVIVKIFGLDGNLPVKQIDIAKEWGTSPQWISDIKTSAMDKLDKTLPLPDDSDSETEK